MTSIEHELFQEFRDSRAEYSLASLIIDGSEHAESYAEVASNGADTIVLGYKTDSPLPTVFIERGEGEDTLVLGNYVRSATNEDELKDLEMELFEWALDEEYFYFQ